ncbi:hypothetical protein RUND412_010169 [Rhizina undulata]
MLLPSAIPCESRSLNPQSSVTPRRSTRQITTTFPSFLSSLHSPPNEPLTSSTTANLLHTCKRLHQILSVDRSAPVPASTNRVQKRSRATTAAACSSSSSSDSAPKTPRRTAVVPPQKVVTPIRKNKRRRAIAFPDSSESEAEVERDPFTTPKPKRRMMVPPSPPNRNIVTKREEDDEWTAAEDQALVELVLQKLKLSWGDWEECAQSLGRRDARSVGRRWEGLISESEVVLKGRRK